MDSSYLNEIKTTVIRSGKLAMSSERYFAASRVVEGLNVMAIEHVAARLAGGLLEVIGIVQLREIVAKVITDVDLGELSAIQSLPGVPKAAATSLMKLWMSDVDTTEIENHPRMQAILNLEKAVLEAMPAHLRRPADLREMAIKRAHLASRIFGQITIKGMSDIHPVWRPLLIEIAKHQPERKPLVWDAGPRSIPEWLDGNTLISASPPTSPQPRAITCANARHEVVEAIRWVRQLMVSGVDGSDIAIATTSTAAYDDIFAAAADEADIAIHFVHGRSCVHTKDGQACAALADVLLRGISQKRVRRLVDLCIGSSKALNGLPDDWYRHLKPDASLTTSERWANALDKASSRTISSILVPFVRMLEGGASMAEAVGPEVLSGLALKYWEQALKDGPPHALDKTLPSLKAVDESDPLFKPCFMSAGNLASAPRSYVRLIGVTSHAWPRYESEDALIPDHVIRSEKLNPRPLHKSDEEDWRTILKTANDVVLSWPRRDGDGRKVEPSGLIPTDLIKDAVALGRSRCAEHAMSEGDRLFCRPDEFSELPHAERAASVIRDWYSPEWTAHDGLIDENHPRIVATLARVQSATSLRKLLRDPISYVWQYALGFRAPEYEDEPLLIEPRQFGNLLHAILQNATDALEKQGGFHSVSHTDLVFALRRARIEVKNKIATEQPVPPELIWTHTLERAQKMAEQALTFQFEALPGQLTLCEIPFGNEEKNIRNETPIFEDCTVTIPGTDIRVEGVIDRLDLSSDSTIARVVDYKTGKTPKNLDEIRLKGGDELQRPLYYFAVKSLMASVHNLEAGLFYLSTGKYAAADDLDALVEDVAMYVQTAVGYLLKGYAVPGEGAKDNFNQHLFAHPANASATYLQKSTLSANTYLPGLVKLWSEK